MKRLIIVEDEKNSLETITEILKKQCPKVKIVSTASTVKEAVEKIDKYKPDLILLDVNLPDGKGTEIFSKIKFKDFKTIFTTAFEDYAIQAIKLSAVDYLLKPVNPKELKNAIDKAIKLDDAKEEQLKISAILNNLNNIANNNKKIVFKTSDSFYVVNIQNIVYCEADNNYTFVYLNDKRKILVSKTLKEFEQLLKNWGFLRVHRSYLANVNYISRFDKDKNLLYMQDGTHISVSFRKREELINIFQRLMRL